MPIARTSALAGTVAVFAWPAIAARLTLAPPSFLWLTAAFILGLALTVLAWPRAPAADTSSPPPGIVAAAVVAVSAAAVIVGALIAWITAILARPIGADMLIVIREGTRRLLDGMNPYAHYLTYDAPWDMVLPYGPLLWGPYLLPQLFAVDLRVVTIVGELTVPIWIGVAAALEARRQRLPAALAWLALLFLLVLGMHVNAFSLMGHTPSYWPLLLPFAWLVTTRRWQWAAFVLGALLVARTTMVALVPVLLIAIWMHDRARFRRALVLIAAPAAVLLTPFALWDVTALWENMVTSYPRIVKSVVWVPRLDGVIDTIGLTGWLIAHGRQRWVEGAQVLALLLACLAAWRAIRRGHAPLPWMAVALTAFSMTSLWPVFYLYFDVLLLLAAGAVVDTLGPRFTPGRWALGVAVTAAAVVTSLLAMTEPYPTWTFEPAAARVTFAVPRRAIGAAVVEVDVEVPAVIAADATLAAVLNGQRLWAGPLSSGRQRLAFPAPETVWQRGFNQLDLSPVPPSPGVVHRIGVRPWRGD